ncbi:MAG: hypothetical protein II956_08575 [Bacteroidales bacterium]|nr:hypothetical protein [Bacteroidales bacterium]
MKKILTLLFAFIVMTSTMNAQETEPDYLCFEVEAGTTISLATLSWYTSNYTYVFKNDVNIQYSFDKKNWSTLKYNKINVETDCNIYFKGTNTCFYKIDEEEKKIYAVHFVVSKSFKCSGNIMTLIDEIGETTTLTEKYAFAHLFEATPITTAPKLPALVLSTLCYEYMFYECRNLIAAPELPATTLSSGCYSNMFHHCENLTTAPELPATTLASSCYSTMFSHCESLTTAPELPATTLASNCYTEMFSYCESLTVAPKLPATTLASSCYLAMFTYCKSLIIAPKLPATTLASSCYTYMFEGCSNLLIAPELPATILAERCYEQMFSECKSLTTTPILPANELKSACYRGMFGGCSNLEKTAPILFEAPHSSKISSGWERMFVYCNKLKYMSVRFNKWTYNSNYGDIYITKQWVLGVNNGSGTFVCPSTLPKEYSEDCIPFGWTVKSLDEIIGYNIRVTDLQKITLLLLKQWRLKLVQKFILLL